MKIRIWASYTYIYLLTRIDADYYNQPKCVGGTLIIIRTLILTNGYPVVWLYDDPFACENEKVM